MLNKKLKIFIYNNNGEMIKEHDYSSFVKILLEIIDHNIEHENDQWNLIHGSEYPPEGFFWDSEIKELCVKEKTKIIKNQELTNFIKSFGV